MRIDSLLRTFLLASVALIFAPTVASQCTAEWSIGSGDGVPREGFVAASTMWGPAGTGPMAPRVAASGDFVLSGGRRHLARWDGSNWTALGTTVNGGVATLAIYTRVAHMPLGDAADGSSIGSLVTSAVAVGDRPGTAWLLAAPGGMTREMLFRKSVRRSL